MEYRKAAALRRPHHQVRALRGTSDAQHTITAREQTLGDRMKDLVERSIANPLGACHRHQWKSEPLANEWNVTGTE